MRLMIAVLVVFGYITIGLIDASGQSAAAAKTPQLPKGARLLSASEAESVRSMARSQSASLATESVKNRAAQPYFTIRVTGDPYQGINVVARAVRDLPKGSITFGERISTTGVSEYLMPVLAEETIQPDWFWYHMENFRKATWTDNSGVIEYRMWIFAAGQPPQVVSAYKNFNSYNVTNQLIKDGISATVAGNPHFFLFGDFNGVAGASLYGVETGLDISVPAEAIKVSGNMIDIDLSKFDGSIPPDDYVVTITGAGMVSGNYTMRLNDTEITSNPAIMNRLRALMDQYR
jgi:hypothetical protein